MPKLAATAATNAAATRRSKRRENTLPRQAPEEAALAARVAEIKGGLALNGDIFVSDERAWLQLLIENIGVRERHCRWPTPANSLCTQRHPGDLRRQSGGILTEDAGSTQQKSPSNGIGGLPCRSGICSEPLMAHRCHRPRGDVWLAPVTDRLDLIVEEADGNWSSLAHLLLEPVHRANREVDGSGRPR